MCKKIKEIVIKHHKGLICGMGVLIILMPFFVGILVSIPSFRWLETSNDWIGFWGSYISAIVAILVPIYILYKQRGEDRKRAVLPMLSIMQNNGMVSKHETEYKVDYLYYNNRLEMWLLSDYKHEEVKKEIENKEEWFCTDVLVKNIGIGPVMNLKVYIKGKELYITDETLCIETGATVQYHIAIEGCKLSVEKDSDNSLFFCFEDVYRNKYRQECEFGVKYENNKYLLTNIKRYTQLIEGE